MITFLPEIAVFNSTGGWIGVLACTANPDTWDCKLKVGRAKSEEMRRMNNIFDWKGDSSGLEIEISSGFIKVSRICVAFENYGEDGESR